MNYKCVGKQQIFYLTYSKELKAIESQAPEANDKKAQSLKEGRVANISLIHFEGEGTDAQKLKIG